MNKSRILRDSEKFISLSLDYFCIANKQCYFIELSDNWSQLLGYSIEELCSKPFVDFVHTEDVSEVKSKIKELLKGNRTTIVTCRFMKKSGSVCYLSWKSIYEIESDAIYSIVDDITPLFEDQVIIAEKNKELSSYENLLNDHYSVAKTNLEGEILYVNKKFCELSGYTTNELIGKTHRIIKSNEHDKMYFDEMWDTILSGKPWKGEIKNRKKSGEKYWVDVTISPIFDSKGRIKEFISVRKDISQQKLLEKELRDKKSKLELILEQSPCGFLTFDIDGQCTYANKYWQKKAGVGIEDHLMDKWFDHIHKNELKEVKEKFILFMGGEIKRFHLKHKLKNKMTHEVFLMDTKVVPLCEKGDPEKIHGYLGVSQDVTEIHAIQKNIHENQIKLIESERSLHEAQRLAKMGSWRIDLKTQVYNWTEQMFSLFGLENNGKAPTFDEFYKMVHPSDQKKWKDMVIDCIGNGKSYEIIYRVVCHQNILWVEENGEGIFDSKGAVSALTGTCHDITEKILKEEELEAERSKVIQTSKLSTLGEMAGGVAHEINNPLAIVQGFVSKLEKLAKTEETVASKEVLRVSDKVLSAVDRMTKIVSGLRIFARDGSLDSFEKVKFSKIIEDTLSFCRTRFQHQNISLNIDIKSDVEVECREVQISQVLLNLINNAFDVLVDEEADEKWVNVKSTVNGEFLKVRVSDSGPGIPEEVLSKIFDPFYTTKAVGKGTGLGLSISQGIIESHHGTLSFLSGAKNTTFELTIPLQQELEEEL